MRRVAYCEVPKLAGVYTFAVNLAEHLPRHGYTLKLVGVGPQAAADYARSLSLVPADVVAPEATDAEEQAEALNRWLAENEIDIVMVSGSETEHRLVPQLASNVRAVSVVNNATRGHYRVATAHHDRLHRLVCVSPRLVHDIVTGYGVPADKVRLIPYGIPLRTPLRLRDGDTGRPLRLVYLGRLCESAKGIFLIPKILRRLERRGVVYHLTVIGDGPDADAFARRMANAKLAHRWTLKGLKRYDAVPDEMATHDIQLLPSRHEGLPLTLLEGMAAGCVPVASRLVGITDYAITDGVHGCLCEVGRPRRFADAIAALDRDRARLRAMSAKGTERIGEAFTSQRMAAEYAALFDAIMTEPARAAARASIAVRPRRGPSFAGLAGWGRRLPAPIKNMLRTAFERAGRTV
jgi:CheY-like chemotaxis protein